MEGLPIKSQTEGIMFHVSPLLFSVQFFFFFLYFPPGEAFALILLLSILFCLVSCFVWKEEAKFSM